MERSFFPPPVSIVFKLVDMECTCHFLFSLKPRWPGKKQWENDGALAKISVSVFWVSKMIQKAISHLLLEWISRRSGQRNINWTTFSTRKHDHYPSLAEWNTSSTFEFNLGKEQIIIYIFLFWSTHTEIFVCPKTNNKKILSWIFLPSFTMLYEKLFSLFTQLYFIANCYLLMGGEDKQNFGLITYIYVYCYALGNSQAPSRAMFCNQEQITLQ